MTSRDQAPDGWALASAGGKLALRSSQSLARRGLELAAAVDTFVPLALSEVRLPVHYQPQCCVALLPDGRSVVTGDLDGIRVWDVPEGTLRAEQPEVSMPDSLAVSGDGRLVLVGGYEQLYLTDAIGLAVINTWALPAEAVSWSDVLETASAEIVACAPDGTLGLSVLMGASTARVWSLPGGELRHTLEPPGRALEVEIEAAAFSPDGRTIVMSIGEALYVWSAESGALLRKVDIDSDACALAFTATDTILAVDYSGVRTRNLTREELVLYERPDEDAFIAAVAGTDLVVSSGHDEATIDLYSLRDRSTASLAGHTGEVKALATSPGTDAAVSIGGDGTIRYWDLSARREVACFGAETGDIELAFTSAGDRAIAVGPDGGFDLLDLTSGNAIERGRVDGPLFRAFIVAGDSRAIFAGVNTYAWDFAGTHAPRKLALARPRAVSPDGRYAIMEEDDVLCLWDLEGDRLLRELTSSDDYPSCSFAEGDAALVAWDEDEVLRVERFDCRSAAPGEQVLRCEAGYPWAISPTGRHVLNIAYDGTLEIWELGRENKAPVTLPTDEDVWFDHVCWGNRGTRFLTAGSNVLRLWDLGSLRMLCEVTAPPRTDIDRISLLADDRRIVCEVRDGRLLGWRL